MAAHSDLLRDQLRNHKVHSHLPKSNKIVIFGESKDALVNAYILSKQYQVFLFFKNRNPTECPPVKTSQELLEAQYAQV